MIRAIAHPTDFSAEGRIAFDHALALALHHRARLDLLHVGAPGAEGEWQRFPRVRARLVEWGRLSAGSEPGEVARQTGVEVRKIELHAKDPAEGLGTFLADHHPDVVVMTSHGRTGLARLLQGSVTAQVARESQAAMLLFGPHSGGFADPANGTLTPGRVLVPVDHKPLAETALDPLEAILAGLGAQLDGLHVGTAAPALHGLTVRLASGGTVDTILAEADGAGLIAMPTEGRHGLRDALLGSTAERVLAGAKVPVLALPAG